MELLLNLISSLVRQPIALYMEDGVSGQNGLLAVQHVEKMLQKHEREHAPNHIQHMEVVFVKGQTVKKLSAKKTFRAQFLLKVCTIILPSDLHTLFS